MGLQTAVLLLFFAGSVFPSPVERLQDQDNSPSASLPIRECGVDDELYSEETSGARHRRNVLPGTVLWANRTIYYYLDEHDFPANGSSEDRNRRRLVKAGLHRIERSTCINIVESRTAQNRIKIESKRPEFCGVASRGMKGGEQKLDVTCFSHGAATLIHELLHTIGISHTQERPDRDNYIIVRHVHHPDEGMKLFVPFDFASIMQGDNFDTKDPRFQFTVGARFPSFYDILNVNLMYDCHELCPTKISANCKNGGYPNPKNCQVCNCPLGYAGPLCDQQPKDGGQILNATTEWQSYSWQVLPRSSNVELNDESSVLEHQEIDFSFRTHWIQVPTGMELEVRVTNANAPHCRVHGLEIRNDPNVTNSSPRICSKNFKTINPVISVINTTPIVSWSFHQMTEFAIEYRLRSR